jgi:DNA invertase Pin-like site-specific DNA recombinase
METQLTDGMVPVPCAIYTRVSTDEQAKEEHYSLAAQEEYCLGEINKRKSEGWYHKITICDPGYTGGIVERPGFLKLIELAKSGEIKVAVVYSRSRLFRDASIAAQIGILFKKTGVIIHSYIEGESGSSPHAIFTTQLTDSLSELERAVTRARVRDAIRYGAKRGDWKGGTPPFGYSYTVGTKTLQICPTEGPIVRIIFERIASGIPVSEICADLRRQGIRGRPSRRWKSQGGEARQVFFTGDAIRTMIALPIYRGVVRVRSAPESSPSSKGKTLRWEEYKARHTPLVDENLWFAANKLLSSEEKKHRAVSTRGNEQTSGLLQGLIRCGCCDAAMSPSASQRKKKSGEPHVYYRCTQLMKGCDASGCTTRSISRDAVETALFHIIHLCEDASTALPRFGYDGSDRRRAAAIATHSAELQRINRAIEKEKLAIKNLMKFVRESGTVGLTPETYQEAEQAKLTISTLEFERVQCEAALRHLQLSVPPVQVIAEAFSALSKGLMTADFEAKRGMLRRVIHSVRIDRITPLRAGMIAPFVGGRVFRMKVKFRASELILAETKREILNPVPKYSDIEISTTFEIRSNAMRQTVALLEHGLKAVSSSFSPVELGDQRQAPTLGENPIQRALRWRTLIEAGRKTAVAVAAEESVSTGLISQHLSLLKLPSIIIEFAQGGRDATLTPKLTLRELQRWTRLSAGEATAAFLDRVSGRPIQQTLGFR